jgi:hypothetical protein
MGQGVPCSWCREGVHSVGGTPGRDCTARPGDGTGTPGSRFVKALMGRRRSSVARLQQSGFVPHGVLGFFRAVAAEDWRLGGPGRSRGFSRGRQLVQAWGVKVDHGSGAE